MNFISGEKLQLIAELYIGSNNDFISNPFINKNPHAKQIDLRQIAAENLNINNPKIVYCHGHYIPILSLYIHLLSNPFVLITHNSDYNIIDSNITQNIVNYPKLIMWYGQNIGYEHDKISFLPIGIANRMWEHGNPDIFDNMKDIRKTKNIFMNFLIYTNFEKRQLCSNTLIAKNIPFLPQVTSRNNIQRMKSYKFCICPDGNGFDTHRLWEAYYVKCVPILLKSTFSDMVRKETGLPMILLNSWDELDIDKLPNYNEFDFTIKSEYLSFEFYKNKILFTANSLH